MLGSFKYWHNRAMFNNTPEVSTVFHLYIKDKFIKSYNTASAAQGQLAKMRHNVDITGWNVRDREGNIIKGIWNN